MQSHLSMLCEISQAKFIHFNRNHCEFRWHSSRLRKFVALTNTKLLGLKVRSASYIAKIHSLCSPPVAGVWWARWRCCCFSKCNCDLVTLFWRKCNVLQLPCFVSWLRNTVTCFPLLPNPFCTFHKCDQCNFLSLRKKSDMYFDTYNQDWNWIKLKEIKSNQDICDNTQPYKKHKKCIIKYG